MSLLQFAAFWPLQSRFPEIVGISVLPAVIHQRSAAVGVHLRLQRTVALNSPKAVVSRPETRVRQGRRSVAGFGKNVSQSGTGLTRTLSRTRLAGE